MVSVVRIQMLRGRGGDLHRYVDAMTVRPSMARYGLIKALFDGLKRDGVWQFIDAGWLIAADTAQAGYLNFREPARFTLTPVASPTFTQDRGVAGNGTSSYLDTGWIAGVNGRAFTQGSASIGIYANAGTDTASDTVRLAGATSSALVTARSTAGTLRGQLCDNTTVDLTGGAGVATRLGLTAFERTASNLVTGYRGGTANGTKATASAALTATRSLYLGCTNNGGTAAQFSDNRIAFAYVGGAMGATLQAALSSRVTAYLTSLGAN